MWEWFQKSLAMHKSIRIFLSLTSIFFISQKSNAQIDSTWQEKPQVILSGFVDVFYVYDFNEPISDFRQPFFYNHNRHNEFNLNLGLVKFALEQPKYRANLALQTGTYAFDNYAAEDDVMKNIYEANVGLSLNQKNNLWLDAGILGSHIGFESAISIDNPTLTRSILAENSPYFLAGTKLTYKPNEKWEVAALIINGWQRIKRVEGNSLPSFGTQFKYSPSEKITLNWSTFFGTDDPNETRRMRYFNNFYGIFQISENINATAGFDIGLQQEAKNSKKYDNWFSPIAIVQYQINERWKTAFRAEYYQDKTGIIIPTETKNGFKTSAFSLNLDYSPIPKIACRVEGRFLKSKDAIFSTDDSASKNDFFIGTSLAIRFAENL